MSALRLPRYQPGQDVQNYLDALVLTLEQALNARQAGAYKVTNATALRTLDSSTATAAQTVQVLATLIQDLRTGGVLG